MTGPEAAEAFQRTAALEVLFAQAEQRRIFLLMAAGGAVLGLLLQAAGWMHRMSRPAGMAADVLCGAAGLALAGWAGASAGGLRLFALLGLLTGLALYRAGIHPLAEGAVRLAQKLFPHGRNDAP